MNISLHIVYGLGMAANGDGNGLRKIGDDVHTANPSVSVDYSSYLDDVISKVLASYTGQPLVLVGHSLGGDAVIKVAKALQLKGIRVAALIALDPVPRDNAQPFNTTDFIIPDNIDFCSCFYRNRWYFSFPFSFPIRGSENGAIYKNYLRSWGHVDFCNKDEIKDEINLVITNIANQYK